MALKLYHTLLRDVQRHQLQQHRSFSNDNKSNNDNETTSPSSDDASNVASSTPSSSQPARTDPDFAEYLAGEEEEEDTIMSDDLLASKQRRKKLAGAQPAPQYKFPSSASRMKRPVDDFNTETYRYIRRNQKTRVERHRLKTAMNVRRALFGNVVICFAKLGAWMSSGSSSMLSEFIHSVVDCGNQSLLLVGLRDSKLVADGKHPYGYGKSVYFWALVSALGTFFMGAGISMTHATGELMNPSLQEITWQVWAVLAISLGVDGYVFGKTWMEIKKDMPSSKKDQSMFQYIWTLRDPATLAIILEDGAACAGVALASAGIAATHFSGMPLFDGLAGVSISFLLAGMGVALVRVNQRFLLGQAVDKEVTDAIEKMLLSQKSIDNVYSVQSQWTGPETFSYKAEVDFDGTYLAAKILPRYQREFMQADLNQELHVLLSWYAEDVVRTTEREVRRIEATIRQSYPGAEFIELEPMSKDIDRFAIDDGVEGELRRVEIDSLNRYLKSLYQQGADTVAKTEGGKSAGNTKSSTTLESNVEKDKTT
uniref:Cation efflux protein transmembrane domain-containing protein n=1 Tax=Grammatophora oceanica TaxID=210454 RepID=A0A6U5PQ18_9STRA